jgi:hypothetical protein
MDIRDSIRFVLEQSDFVWHNYVKDLTSAELLARPCSGANHVAWQLGHLIGSERYLCEKVSPGSMPALPAGFVEQHKKDTAANNDPSAFASKEEYLRLAKEMREGTLKLVANLPAARFDEPISGGLPPFLKHVGEVLLFIPGHWLMHAGQWAIIRRSIGRPPVF